MDADATDDDTVELFRLQTLFNENPQDEKKRRFICAPRDQTGAASRRHGVAAPRDASLNALGRRCSGRPTKILIIRANIRQIDHRFDDALEDLRIALEREPTNPQALLSRAFILATTGKAKTGLQDCAALRPSISVAISRNLQGAAH